MLDRLAALIPDDVDRELATLYRDFVDRGGLDRVWRVDEDWERAYRHRIKIQPVTRGWGY